MTTWSLGGACRGENNELFVNKIFVFFIQCVVVLFIFWIKNIKIKQKVSMTLSAQTLLWKEEKMLNLKKKKKNWHSQESFAI